MISCRQLIRQVQRGDNNAIIEIIEELDGLLVQNALRYQSYFRDFEEAKAIGTCAVLEGIRDYDLQNSETVVLHMVKHIRRKFNKEKRAVKKQDEPRKKNDDDRGYVLDDLRDMADPKQLSLEDVVLKDEQFRLLRRARASLPTIEQQMLVMKYEEGKTQAEIGGVLGMSTRTVGSRFKKIHQKLYTYMTTNQEKTA